MNVRKHLPKGFLSSRKKLKKLISEETFTDEMLRLSGSKKSQRKLAKKVLAKPIDELYADLAKASEVWLSCRVHNFHKFCLDPDKINPDVVFQGIFSTEEKAIASCRDESYFIMPFELDVSLPHKKKICKRAYYP